MKYPSAFAKSLVMAAWIGMVVPLGAQTIPAKPVKPAKPATPSKEEAPKIDGFEVKRPGGGFLGVKVDGLKLVVSFYGEEKKPVSPGNVARASARWNPVNKKGDERAVLDAAPGGKSLESPAIVRPPYTFRLYLTLLDENGNVVESHVIDARELNTAKD